MKLTGLYVVDLNPAAFLTYPSAWPVPTFLLRGRLPRSTHQRLHVLDLLIKAPGFLGPVPPKLFLLLFSFSSSDAVHGANPLLDGLPRHRPSPDPFCWHTSRLNGSITDGLQGPHQTPIPSCTHTSRHDDPILDGLRGPRQTPNSSSPLTYEPNPWLNPGQTSGALPNTQPFLLTHESPRRPDP